MQLRKLGATNVSIAPLVLGGNVFGWTADRETSFAILDAFHARGFNAIDTADVYARFIPGLKGGESETLLGEWMKERGNRKDIVLITKGGLEMGKGLKGLGREYLRSACDASLRRLQTDYIDLYMAHRADPSVPIGETLETFDGLLKAGKIRHAGCSNYTADELSAALARADATHAPFEVLQPYYNLIHRNEYEGALESLCRERGLGVITYFSLASGFLTGKYRKPEDLAGKPRGGMISRHLNPSGLKLLDALDRVSARHQATPAQVALAWLMARPGVTAPIASATSVAQLSDILKSVDLTLSRQDLAELEPQ
jgi:aryl-alcohol dehydrogenase-like predicted oxidoreductase